MCEETLARTPSCWSLMLLHQLVGCRSEPSRVRLRRLRPSSTKNAPERVGVGSHPARRLVQLSRRRPLQERFRTRERQSGAPSILTTERAGKAPHRFPLHFIGAVARDGHTLAERLTNAPFVWSNCERCVQAALNSITSPSQPSLRRTPSRDRPRERWKARQESLPRIRLASSPCASLRSAASRRSRSRRFSTSCW